MKKEMSKNNFTKLTHEKGISLIVLIITIIVIIILASVVILNISKNNPIESAKEAKFKEDVRNFQYDLSLSITKDYTAKEGKRDDKFNATTLKDIQEYIPSFTKKYEGKLVIKDNELKYSEDLNENEKKWLNDLGVKENVKMAAEKVAEDVNYYGKGITNYTANGVSDWKIFYSDGNNVYLIASDYIDVSKLPITDKGHKPENVNNSYINSAAFDNVINDYNGSSDITDEKIKKLNNDYFNEKRYTCTTSNLKKVAYMLDSNIWSGFKTDKAEYAIGGPTIEILMASYSKKYGIDYMTRAKNKAGYEMSGDGGKSWVTYYDKMLNKSDSLYVISSMKNAWAMWLASPSAYNSDSIMYVSYSGSVHNSGYSNIPGGFRPLVCLNSNVLLETDGDGYKIK